MTNHSDILRELDAYAKAVGIDASTVCRKATGNPRLRERLANRIKRTAQDIERLRQFMANNPPVQSGSVSLACPDHLVAKENNFKGATHETR
jgi:hypothetical protein